MSGICQGITWGRNDDVNSMPAAGAGYADFLSERAWLSANQSGGGNHAGIAERFQKWVEMGVLTVTDGAEVDYRYILEEAKAANKISPVSESPIDPFGATGLSHDLADEDLNPITIIQNYTNMSDPMKELERA